jgi:SAM-dependent methyltransferase
VKAAELTHWQGRVLDVGCADGRMKTLLRDGAHYIGLDYYDTAVDWYKTRPDLFGDAQALPLADDSVDNVLMLHVLEHLQRPDSALNEVARVLRGEGALLVEVPFAYPSHDTPLDFRRWTQFGLAEELSRAGFEVLETRTIGASPETAALLLNLTISRLLMDWGARRSLWLVLAPVLAVLIPVLNLTGRALAAIEPSPDFLPSRVRASCRKKRA